MNHAPAAFRCFTSRRAADVEADRSSREPLRSKRARRREMETRRRRLAVIAGLGMMLCLGPGLANAQPACTPSTTPCQTCPPPPPCTPSSTPCGPVGPTSTTSTASSQTCSGSFAQETITVEEAIGPINICTGPDRSVGCFVPAGTNNFNVHVDTLLGAGTVAIPALSFWGLGALAITLAVVALRRIVGAAR
jgi:hypothetical protein